MTELDKFKRRTIRSVARLLRQKKPPDELWSEMKKETGTDCRVLWERMRALCVKKLNRMLAVDDRSDSLPSIARLSLTDWLLVDLVLVHEKIDVIAMDKVDNKAEQKPLVQLFNLVQRFDVEGRSGEALAEAWAAATVFYNRQGRQCSPMLLQRRWYQLKKLTRCRFYNFWQSYRGNTKLLASAKRTMPTRLQMAVAKRYPAVITGEFPDWEELIERKLIILPEEFESKMRMTNLPKPCNSNDPDIVVVEPVIETIELGEDSDSEEPKQDQILDTAPNDASVETNTTDPTFEHQATESEELFAVKVKSEPIEEDCLSNVQVVATTHVTELEIPDEGTEHDENSSEVNNENQMTVEQHRSDDLEFEDFMGAASPNVDESPSPPENSETNMEKTSSKSTDSEDDVIEIPNVVPQIEIDLESQTKAPTEEIMPIISSVSSTTNTQSLIDGVVEDLIKLKADEYCRKESTKVPESNLSATVDDLIKDKIEIFFKTPKENTAFNEKKPDISAINLNTHTVEATAIDLMADLNFDNDGLEFIDDGVEFMEEMDEPKREPDTNASPDHETSKEADDNNKFDLKLLMDPVVYTTKLDQMNIFTNKQLGSVDKIEDIEKIIAESKPKSKKSFNICIKQEDTTSQNDDTNNTEDMGVDDDLFTSQASDDDMEEIKVSPNNYMLKKPRTRTYNPIQLCKNPDFNTKLRRLAIGFFGSPRNRQLLNVCIPMTIDVSKAFESKLVDGTLYLKSTGVKSSIVEEPVIDKEPLKSVVPSTLPIQSLLDNSKTDIHQLIQNPHTETIPTSSIPSISSTAIDGFPNPTLLNNSSHVAERKKIINLPDIEKVRRINQQLLTAQVPPIRVYAGNSYRPPLQPTATATDQVEAVKPPQVPQPVPTVSDFAPILSSQPSILPTVVKVESEALQHDTELLAPDSNIPSDPLPPAKQKLITIINQAKLTTQEALTKIDVGGKSSASDDLKQLTLVRKPASRNGNGPKKNMYSRISVPWTKSKYVPRPENIDDFLITDDTLNKMLHLMSGNEDEKNCACCSLKQRKNEWNKASKAKKKKEELAKKMQEKKVARVDGRTEVTQEKEPGIDDQDSRDLPEKAGTNSKNVLAKGRVVRYCCWARQKINNRKRITKHTCLPDECVCCCRPALDKMFEERDKLAPIELSDDDDKSLKMACESIEKVVQQAHHDHEDQTPTRQNLVIMRTISTSTEPSQLETTLTDNSLSLNQGGLVSEAEPLKAPPPVITKIIPQLTQSEMPSVYRKKSGPYPKAKPYIQSPKEQLCVPCPCQKPAETSTAQLRIVIDASRNIVLDASKKCHLHPPPPPPPQSLTPIPIAPKENKILYLHSKSIAKTPTECPIFLGKNKILLTTVKFPRKKVSEEPPFPQCEVFQAPKIIPTLPLPTGVQLVLLPSGSVTYTVDQGVELTEEQLASLPTIITAVQEQLNSSPVPALSPIGINPSAISGGQSVSNVLQPVIANAPAADVSPATNLEAQEVFQDEELPRRIKQKEELNKIANASVDTASINAEEIDKAKATSTGLNLLANETVNNESQAQSVAESEKITKTQSNAELEKPAVTNTVAGPEIQTETLQNSESRKNTETKSVAGSDIQTESQSVSQSEPQTVITNPVEAADQNSDGVDSRKTLLSDLMEMSGISAEDATAAEPVATEQVPVLINTDQKNLPELSPVTSFAELKYACENDGKFFKLDFETGVIVPINVCIKKNPKPKAPARVKAVIDLTDEMDDSNESTTTQATQDSDHSDTFANKFKQYVYKGRTLTVPDLAAVKPVKLFKAVHQPSLLKRQFRLDPKSDSNPTDPKKHNLYLQRRKQNLNRVEAVLDLVDSDSPMEEEYLMDSSDTESFHTENEPMLIEALEEDAFEEEALEEGALKEKPLGELDYSSDDEPLAKKSKRMKEVRDETDTVIETNIRDAINVAMSENPDPKPNSSEAASPSATTNDLEVPMGHEDEPKDGNETLSKNDSQPEMGPEHEPKIYQDDPVLDQERDPDVDPELRFMSGPSDNEGGEEDCILGV